MKHLPKKLEIQADAKKSTQEPVIFLAEMLNQLIDYLQEREGKWKNTRFDLDTGEIEYKYIRKDNSKECEHEWEMIQVGESKGDVRCKKCRGFQTINDVNEQEPKRWDWDKDKEITLREEIKKILEEFTNDIEEGVTETWIENCTLQILKLIQKYK